MTDAEVWVSTHPNDIWIYDKLILSKRLGYKCGPVDVPVPAPGNYIVRPITNMLGMGIDAEDVYIESSTEHLRPGHFWVEKFKGRHLSVDYINKEMVQCVEGFRNPNEPLWKWRKWQTVKDEIVFPNLLHSLHDTKHINCEFIDGHLIEVHQRLSTDMDGYDEIIPVWIDEPMNEDMSERGYTYFKDTDYYRVGFWKK